MPENSHSRDATVFTARNTPMNTHSSKSRYLIEADVDRANLEWGFNCGPGAADVDRANLEWGFNCGPGAVAAMLSMTPDQIRPHLGDFESKGYTNPTLMYQILGNLKCGFFSRRGNLGRSAWPEFGLARIQWEGPWTQPGVPARAAYRFTHWVGVKQPSPGNIGIFDINALANGTGWCRVEDWADVIVPYILRECCPRSDGGWHLTHAIELKDLSGSLAAIEHPANA
jgi:hypothetical protein